MLFSAIFDICSVFKEYNREALITAIVVMILYITAVVVIFAVKKQKTIPHRSRSFIVSRFVFVTIFAVYFSYFVCLTLSGREAGSRGEIMNVIPFATIFDTENSAVPLIENVILFIPFGILFPVMLPYFRRSIRTAIAGLAASALIESLQLVTGRGYFDTDDIILNACGALAGYLLFAGIYDGYWGIRRRVIIDCFGDNTRLLNSQSVYERFALKNNKVLLAVQAVPTMIWYFIIMGFSSNNGYQSGYLSKSLLYNILVMLGGAEMMSNITEDIDEQIALMDFWEAILRKLAHMFEYAVFAVLVWAMLYSIVKLKKTYAYNVALIAVSAVGTADEINQMSVIGRTGTYVDVIVDLIGAAIAMIAVTYVMMRINRKYALPGYLEQSAANAEREEL